MVELRSVLHDLQVKLNSIISRIPETTATEKPAPYPKRAIHSIASELPMEGPSGCPEQYHSVVLVAFHKWARIILSLFIDKVDLSMQKSPFGANIDVGILCCLPTIPKESSKSNLAHRAPKVSVATHRVTGSNLEQCDTAFPRIHGEVYSIGDGS
jgi:hypothetical protein